MLILPLSCQKMDFFPCFNSLCTFKDSTFKKIVILVNILWIPALECWINNNHYNRIQLRGQTRLRHKWILPDYMEKLHRENYKLNLLDQKLSHFRKRKTNEQFLLRRLANKHEKPEKEIKYVLDKISWSLNPGSKLGILFFW